MCEFPFVTNIECQEYRENKSALPHHSQSTAETVFHMFVILSYGNEKALGVSGKTKHSPLCHHYVLKQRNKPNTW